jgi:glycosyltransferase involved in cell wall biosynthesis
MRKIVLATTVAQSIKLFGPLPQVLSGNGWEVHFVSSPGPEIQVFADTKICHHSLEMARNPSLFRDLLAFIHWVQLIRVIRPEIIFVGTPKASFLGLVAAWFARVPNRIYGLWGLRMETTEGLGRRLLRALERLTSVAATSVLAVSKTLLDKYLELELCKPQKIFILGLGSSHGVDVERFSPMCKKLISEQAANIGLHYGIPVLGFVGRFSHDKGADTLLATRKLLVERNIDHELLIIGSVEGSAHVLEEISNCGRSVKHVGTVGDIDRYYPLMDMLLLPTRREGFPNVVLEAAASGIPAVTTNATGAADSVVNGVTGITVPVDSSKDFAEAVFELIGNIEARKLFGMAARQRAVAHFSEGTVIDSIVKFLDRLPQNVSHSQK